MSTIKKDKRLLQLEKFFRYLSLSQSCISFKDEFATLVWIFFRISLYLFRSLGFKEKVLYELFYSIYRPIITVKNKAGLFKCRAWTDDILVVSPDTEFELSKFFSLKGGIFVDVGAHIGKYTIMVGKGQNDGEIISIEADKENFEMLQRNIALNNLNNVHALNLAAFRENGEITFYKTVSPHTSGYSVYSKGHECAIKIRATTLDSVLSDFQFDRIDLIKIDVEGAEYDVLFGAKKTLEKTKMVIFESIWGPSSDKCKEFLTMIGFEIKDLGNNIVATKNLDDNNEKI